MHGVTRPGRAVRRELPTAGAALILALFLLAASADAAPPTGGLAAQPIVQQIILGAGADSDAAILLRNESASAPLPVQLTVADLDPSGDLRPAASTPHTLVGILTLPSQEITLAPGETRKIVARVHGDGHLRYGALIATAIADGPHPMAFARIVLRLVVATPGAVPEPEAHLVIGQQGVITLLVKNPGQTLCQGRGALFLLGPDGGFLGRLDIPEFILLPGGETTVTVRWPERLASGTVARAALAIDGRAAPYIATSQAP